MFLEVFEDGNLSENSVHFYDKHAGAATKNTTITLYGRYNIWSNYTGKLV
jgi:hypothetical protein